MKQKPPEKLFAGHRHQPLLALVGIVLPAKRNLAISNIHDPVIGDCDPMRVAGQIVQDMFGASEGTFGIDHPVLSKKRTQKRLEGFLLRKPFQLGPENCICFC